MHPIGSSQSCYTRVIDALYWRDYAGPDNHDTIHCPFRGPTLWGVMKFFDALCTSTALLLAPLAFSPPAIAHPDPVFEAGSAVQSPTTDVDPALWVVKDDDTTIYLFGTIHILRPGLSWFDEAVKDAFDASDELVMEIVQPDLAEAAKLISVLGVDQDGIALRDRLSADERAKYETELAAINYPIAGFDRFEPWFAGITLSSLPLLAKGYDLDSGVEKELTRSATTANLPISGLETPEEQFKMFDTLPMDSQIAFLNLTVAAIPTADREIDKLVDAWGRGDVEALAAIMNSDMESSDDILYNIFLTERNVRWAAWIKERMSRPGTVFLAVGAGHLAGADSVQMQLRSLDIETHQIEY